MFVARSWPHTAHLSNQHSWGTLFSRWKSSTSSLISEYTMWQDIIYSALRRCPCPLCFHNFQNLEHKGYSGTQRTLYVSRMPLMVPRFSEFSENFWKHALYACAHTCVHVRYNILSNKLFSQCKFRCIYDIESLHWPLSSSCTAVVDILLVIYVSNRHFDLPFQILVPSKIVLN